MGYVENFLSEASQISMAISPDEITSIVNEISGVKKSQGRVFFAGSGGGAGHASHATCDFRKLLGIESYCVTDNVTELTARINDESWEESYSSWLAASRISSKDMLFVFSVGGGDPGRKISVQLVKAIDLALSVGASVVGIAGRDGGYLARKGKAIVVPNFNPKNVTAQTEGFQAVIWHLLLGHPELCENAPVWESIEAGS